MKLDNIKKIKENPSETLVRFLGWIKAKRHHGKKLFLDLIDSSGTVQCICDNGMVQYEELVALKLESAIELEGIVSKNESGVEVIINIVHNVYPNNFHLTDIRVIDILDPRYTQVVNKYRHLYIRNPQFIAIMQFRAKVMSYVREWFVSNEFWEVDAPILTPIPLYHDSTAMPISINKSNVFLTQCAGFYLEAMSHALGKIYNMGPSFRAEESRSKRHLMEYWHIKAEMVSGSLETIMTDVESLLLYVITRILTEGQELCTIIGTKLCTDGANGPFPRIDYKDAVELVRDKGCEIEFGTSLSSQEEEILSKYFNSPVWIVGIPEKVEPFPYIINPDAPRQCKVADLICSNGYGELLGTAEKIYNLGMLDKRLKDKGKLGDPRYEWVRQVHQVGCVPHVAFGMGLERLIRWLLNVPHVRDCIPFPREYRKKVYP
jgi:asparaginyl-tRNA synthetase